MSASEAGGGGPSSAVLSHIAQGSGGGPTQSAQPPNLGTNSPSVPEIGGIQTFLEGEGIEQSLDFIKQGPFSGDITSAIDQGSMARAMFGSPPENCMLKDVQEGLGGFAPPSAINPDMIKTSALFQGKGGGA